MIEYHKIQTVFLRDPKTNYKQLMEGVWSKPEFCYLSENMWLVDEKIDGTNIRVMWDGTKMRVGGKTDNAQLQMDLVENINTLFTSEKLAAQFGTALPEDIADAKDLQVCLYGEGYGPGIQKGGGNYRKDKGFILFDIKIGPLWLERQAVKDIALSLGLDVVPEIGVMSLNAAIDMVKKGFNSTFGDFKAEGIIARPMVEMKNRRGERVITKLKHTDYEIQG